MRCNLMTVYVMLPVGSTCSGKHSHNSSESSASSRIKVEADKAALLTRAAALRGVLKELLLLQN